MKNRKDTTYKEGFYIFLSYLTLLGYCFIVPAIYYYFSETDGLFNFWNMYLKTVIVYPTIGGLYCAYKVTGKYRSFLEIFRFVYFWPLFIIKNRGDKE